jgi:hypothetical protein
MTMRHPKPTIASAVLACSLVLALAACGGGDSGPDDHPGAGGAGGTGGTGGSGGMGGDGGTGGEGGCGTEHSIGSLEPDHGPVGATVWIVGCNFDPQPNKNEVYFNGTKSAAFEVSPDHTRLRTAVPSGAISGAIKVLVGDQKLRVDGPNFTIDVIDPVPTISGILPEVTTEARPGFHDTVSLTIQGTGYITQTHVYMQGLSGGQRLLESECHYSSVTSMACVLPEDFILAPLALQFKVVNERPGIAGGGASDWVSFRVVSHLDLLSAVALSERHVALVFNRAVGEITGVGFSGGLQVRAANPAQNNTVLIVELQDSMSRNVNYNVQVDEHSVSSQGGEIWNTTATFRGFNSLPQPIGTYGDAGGGCTATSFQGPGEISIADGQVFVTEREGQQVQVLNPDGTYVGFLGYDGISAGLHTGAETAQGCPTGGSGVNGALKNPRGKVAVDGITGDRIVADTGNGRVLRYTETGEYKSEFGAGHTSPVIAAQLGSQILVADANDRIRVMTGTGSTSGAIGASGTDDGQFNFGIASGGTPTVVSSGVYLFVSEPGNHRVQRLKIDGMQPYGWVGVNHPSFQIQGQCCSAGTGQAEFTNIRGLAMDVAGYLWVADEVNGGRLQKLDPDGKFVMGVILNYLPGGIEIDQDNILWVSDVDANVVRKYRL